MPKPRIALNIIMRDVKDTILPCLNSIGNSLDTYVFVDTGSVDNTKELVENWCKEGKVEYKIIDYKGYKFSDKDTRERKNWGDIPQYEWDFGDAREIALRNTEADWLFWVDSDDVVAGIENLRNVVIDAEMANVQLVTFPYHYAEDGNGNVVVYQHRERLIKLKFDDKKLISKWESPCHEYCIPGEMKGQPMVRTDVRIIHKRTIEHIVETNRRNNRILMYKLEKETLENNRTPRTLSVLAFDHYEHKEWEEAAKYYKELFDKSDKDPQLAMQNFSHLSSYAKTCMALGDINTAHKCAENMILVQPHMAEPYLLKAEIYLRSNNLEMAETYIKLAESRPEGESLSPASPLELKLKPLLMRAEICAKKGDLEQGIECLNRATQIVPGDNNIQAQKREMLNNLSTKEAYEGVFGLREELLNTGELDKIGNLIASIPDTLLKRQEIVNLVSDLKKEWEFYIKRMGQKLSGNKKITIFVGGGYEDWNSETIKEKGSGGSEEMCVRIARELAALGNNVTVYNQSGNGLEGEFDGVKYVDYRKFNNAEPCDIFISERVPQIFQQRINAKRQYLWLHDTHYGEMPRKFFNLPDKILVLSNAHKTVLQDFYKGVNEKKFYVTRNGIDLDMIKKAEAKGIERKRHKLVYSSSYDRGVIRLLKMFPKIRERVSDATLDIYYGFDVYDKRMNMLLKAGNPEGQQLLKNKEELLKLMDQPGVTHKGRVTQQEIIEAYMGAGVWAYPTEFYEISCITGMIAQACGAFPVVSDFAALSETVQYGDKLKMGYSDDAFVAAVEYALICEEIVPVGTEYQAKRKEMMEWARKAYDVKSLITDWNNNLFEK